MAKIYNLPAINNSIYDTSGTGRIAREIKNLRKDIRSIENQKLAPTNTERLSLDSPYVNDRDFRMTGSKFLASNIEKEWKHHPTRRQMLDVALKKLDIL